jgi:hypothetical protein
MTTYVFANEPLNRKIFGDHFSDWLIEFGPFLDARNLKNIPQNT